MRKFTLPLLLCSMLHMPFAMADSPMKPGLWEMTMKSDAMKNMPSMSPAQIEQMRKMGVQIPEMRDGGMVTKVCISPEMLKSEKLPGMQANDTGCEVKNHQQSGNNYSADMICDGTMMKGKGRIQGTYNGDHSFTSSYDFKGTMGGRPVDQRHETSGKWLSADCGGIKPVTEMMPKR